MEFKAKELTKEGKLEVANYSYIPIADSIEKDPFSLFCKYSVRPSQWQIKRNGEDWMILNGNYRILQSVACGICSTDLDRVYFPFPLPQIIGHELVARYFVSGENNPKSGEWHYVCVEINDSHLAHNEEKKELCAYCSKDLDPQCPARITFGIDRLPGGFAPYALAPVNSIFEIPRSLNLETAVLTEPFAAALHGVEMSSPKNGDVVAVLGPRRLGNLIIAALNGYRQRKQLNFEIVAVSRHNSQLKLAKSLGADRLINNKVKDEDEKHAEGKSNSDGITMVNGNEEGVLHGKFDLVFDTTASPIGFELALQMCKTGGVVHLKSTHGKEVMGLEQLTAMVVDEISLMKFNGAESLNFSWPNDTPENRKNLNIYVTPSVSLPDKNEDDRNQAHEPLKFQPIFHQLPLKEATRMIFSDRFKFQDLQVNLSLKGSPFPRFDLAIISSLSELDQILRPELENHNKGLVRTRGAVLLLKPKESKPANLLEEMINEKNIKIHTSRCGSFAKALKMLDMFFSDGSLGKFMISHKFGLGDLDKAFKVATDSQQSVKVMVDLLEDQKMS